MQVMALEREKMRAYPVLGGRILAAIPFPWPVVSIVRHHQEHYAGGGYPDGLTGDSIPLGATGKILKTKLREQFKDHDLASLTP